ncbi:MAG TPA: MerR family transcriptional regulator, partial [Atribacterota bacterium]|nr:MerR family transcriptional regulator [Atribacterota bacterium]
MEYTINKLAKMSGVSTRTLRYYDEIKLLKPARVAISGYRFYKQEQVDMLQQILLYKEMGFLLGDIKKLLSAPDFSKEQTFANHLSALLKRRERLDALILNVKKSLSSLKGEIIMTDSEKFVGFKEKLISENEER